MHEILHTYHFLSLRRKNTFPSFHASWRKSFLYHKNLHTSLIKNIQASWNILRSYKKVLCCLSNEATLRLDLSCALARFSLFQNILRRSTLWGCLVSSPGRHTAPHSVVALESTAAPEAWCGAVGVSPNSPCIPFLFHMQCVVWCLCYANMMWWCYVMQNDICAADTCPCNRAHTLFISALTFRCKPPLGASLPFTFCGISVYFSL
jgi:hypothetical protein